MGQARAEYRRASPVFAPASVTQAQQVQQQTGMPFIIMQQVQPAFIIMLQQSQQAWIMSQQALSPLVQVMQQPISVISHVQLAMVMLQQQTHMPFIIMQQEHMPPAIIMQRFCIMAAETLSSQTQLIFIPPSHFSKVILQRGTIIMFIMPDGIVPAAAPMPIMPIPLMAPGMPIMLGIDPPVIPDIPGIPIPARSIVLVAAI
ncbi:MAG: hypothetical protein ABS79_05000 [Planctomycetes bacterium SCN 63-9]|nr:MAG: hypothetical protein ABS79_05000 [Planctomycetes bacterium SCN 63-9]